MHRDVVGEFRCLAVSSCGEILEYLDKKCRQHKSPPKTVDEMVVFIKNIQDDRVVKSIPNFSNQIQMCAAEQLAETLLHQRANNTHEYSNETAVISPMSSPTPMSPPTPMSTPPPSFTMQSPSRAVDENDGPLHFNTRSLSKTCNFDSAVSEIISSYCFIINRAVNTSLRMMLSKIEHSRY
ncbi:hypothetical protein AGLY_007423 [Aphis glycines]|uniref:Uncharacterized protein n=1 Tax=Aphis glycines TaxID=307491 RepID=A0A6G0TNS0_APHGL|nr:hypothetical protein AGLY_007423 [Aphis glycines]